MYSFVRKSVFPFVWVLADRPAPTRYTLVNRSPEIVIRENRARTYEVEVNLRPGFSVEKDVNPKKRKIEDAGWVAHRSLL